MNASIYKTIKNDNPLSFIAYSVFVILAFLKKIVIKKHWKSIF